MRKLVSCGVLIIRGNPIDDFLLMEHAKRLDLPKGHVDADETEMQCALRELEEETAITHDDIRLDPDFRFEYKYRVWPKKYKRQECKKKLVIFLAELIKPVKIIPTEHQGFRWVTWDPPHLIQEQTIDPLLNQLAKHLKSRK